MMEEKLNYARTLFGPGRDELLPPTLSWWWVRQVKEEKQHNSSTLTK